MGTAVHPQFCTLEVPYHAPAEKVADDILVISYHNEGDAFPVDALVLPCRGLPKPPAATVLGIRTEDPIDQSADNIAPNFCSDLGNKSEGEVLVDNIFAAPSYNPSHQSVGNNFSSSHHNLDEQTAIEAPEAPSKGPNHQAAGEDHLIRSLTSGGPVTAPILVTARHDSEDKCAEITSYHYAGHQPVDDTRLISNYRLEEKTVEDKPADDEFKALHQDRVDQVSNEAPVIPCQKLEISPVNEVLQSWDNGSGEQPTNATQLVPFHDLGPEAPEEAPIVSDGRAEVRSEIRFLTASGDISESQLRGNAFLILDHEPDHSPKDSLSAAENDTDNTHAENTNIETPHRSEHKIADELLVSHQSEDAPTEHDFAASKHELRDKGEDENFLSTHKTLENNHPSDVVVSSHAPGHKYTNEAILTSKHGSEKQHIDDVDLALSRHPEYRPPDDTLLAPSHSSGDQLVAASPMVSSNDSENQSARDALLIISNALNDQPTEDADLAFPNRSNDQPRDGLLVVSPYAFAPHLLRLDSVSKPNQLLAKALTQMRAVRDDYATAAYTESFNWSTVVNTVKDLSEEAAYEWQPEAFYIVVFRSRVRPATNREDLGLIDEKAHAEAMESGGLLKYWFGVADENCRNLATCKFWHKTP